LFVSGHGVHDDPNKEAAMSSSYTRRGLIGAAGMAVILPAAVARTTEPALAAPVSGPLVTLRTPVRVFDSRENVAPTFGAKISANQSVGVTIGAAIDGGPALSAFINVTVTQTEGGGYLVVRGSDLTGELPLPLTSNINWWASGLTLANLVLTTVGGENYIEVHCGAGSTHCIVDLYGWVPG
jgi:hypothetical protein